jgi:hypothetical protein
MEQANIISRIKEMTMPELPDALAEAYGSFRCAKMDETGICRFLL